MIQLTVNYCNDPNFSEGQVYKKNTDPDQTAAHLLINSSVFLWHYSKMVALRLMFSIIAEFF